VKSCKLCTTICMDTAIENRVSLDERTLDSDELQKERSAILERENLPQCLLCSSFSSSE